MSDLNCYLVKSILEDEVSLNVLLKHVRFGISVANGDCINENHKEQVAGQLSNNPPVEKTSKH